MNHSLFSRSDHHVWWPTLLFWFCVSFPSVSLCSSF
jgi:hypothetical protein